MRVSVWGWGSKFPDMAKVAMVHARGSSDKIRELETPSGALFAAMSPVA